MKSNRHKQLVIDIVTKLITYSEIDSIYLYGSCARSQETYYSDVDLFCCLNIPYETKYNKFIRQLNTIDKPLDLPDIDINYIFNNYSFSDIKNFNKSYYINVYNEAILLWNKQSGFSTYYNKIIEDMKGLYK